MNAQTTAPATTATLDVPGATLYFEVRGTGPLVALVGAPMDANAFAPLADLLATEFTVLTTDPRGINRSTVEDRDADSTPELRADDLSLLIAHVDSGPATVFGSSGGAVTALALTQAHPDQVATVIAHEPPLEEMLEDRVELRAATEEMVARYLGGDVVGAWSTFFASANIGMPPGAIAGMFGGERDPQEVADERFWFEHELRPSTYWLPDHAVLQRVSSRLVIGVGEDSAGETCDRTTIALASALDLDRTTFPGGHIAFAEDAAGFVGRLREVIG